VTDLDTGARPDAVLGTDRPPPGGSGHRLQVRGAIKHYGQVRAVDGIDLDIAPGRFLVLLGPSGSGKSTLLRALAGVERLDDGQLRLAGRLVDDGRRHLAPERRDLAMVFQDYALWPHLTVQGNVGYALRRRRLPTAEAHRRVQEILDRVGLGTLAARYPHELSGGEQQRVALARAVVARPGLLLFDEPLSNLDADLRERLRVEIATLTRESGATAVYITHDQSEAFALADLIGVLDRGRLVQLDRPENIYTRPATPFVARFTGLAGELLGRVTAIEDDTAVVDVAGRPLRGQITAEGAAGITRGSLVVLAVRPAATLIVDGDATARHGTLRGTVTDVAYRGRGYDHVVRCSGGVLTSVFGRRPCPRGTEVAIALDPEGCVTFPEPGGLEGDGYVDGITVVRS
jgi:ABC-type Fe3+/spermidine/putrescine transport system ATPase subunit